MNSVYQLPSFINPPLPKSNAVAIPLKRVIKASRKSPHVTSSAPVTAHVISAPIPKDPTEYKIHFNTFILRI